MAASPTAMTNNPEPDYFASPVAKIRDAVCECLVDQVVEFSAYYDDNTSAAAFGLAVHITGDLEQACAAFELGYLQAWDQRTGPTLAVFEQLLLARVGTVAIRIRQDRRAPGQPGGNRFRAAYGAGRGGRMRARSPSLSVATS